MVRRRVLVAVVCALLLGPLSALATPVTATSCYEAPAAGAYQGDDGSVWVVSDRGGDPVVASVHRLSSSLAEPSRTSVEVPGDPFFGTPVDLHRAPNGSWFVLTPGAIHVYSANWSQRTGRIQLAAFDTWGTVQQARQFGQGGLTQDDAGRWWVATGSALYRFDENWTRTGRFDVAADTVGSRDGVLWVVTGGDAIRRVRNASGQPTLGDGFAPDWEASRSTGAIRAGDGWYVLDADGRFHEYTAYGQYTGQTVDHQSMRLNFRCPGLGSAFLWYVLGVVWLGGTAATTAFLRPSRWQPAVIAAGAGTLGAVAFYHHVLPWPFAAVYWLPDAGIAAALAVGVLSLVATVRDDWLATGVVLALVAPLAAVAALYSLVGAGAVGVLAVGAWLRRR